MNCFCDNTFDLRCVCYPRKDYRVFSNDNFRKTHNIKPTYDFRKCPMRFTYAMEFIHNDYDKYKLIENGKTEKKRITILKNIIIKDYKLTKEDFEIILKDYLVTEDNLINNYKEPIVDDEPIEIYIPNELWKHIKEFMIDYKFKEKLPSYKKIYEIFAEHYYWSGYWGNSTNFDILKCIFNRIFENKMLRKIALGLLKINVEILQKIYDKEVSYLTSRYTRYSNCFIEEEASRNAIDRNIFYIRWILIAVYNQDDIEHSRLAHRLLNWYIL